MRAALSSSLLFYFRAQRNIFLGCASLPERGTAKEPAVFEVYSVADQKKSRKGKVALGFTEEQDCFALGEPDETWTEIDKPGETLSWA